MNIAFIIGFSFYLLKTGKILFSLVTYIHRNVKNVDGKETFWLYHDMIKNASFDDTVI